MADDSVLTSLRELHDIEHGRIAEERRVARAAAERSLAAAAEAERLAAEALAEEEREAMRLRVQAEAAARHDLQGAVDEATSEVQSRVDALRAELDAVQAERRFLHERAVLAASVQPEPRKTRGWAAGFAAMSAVAMALAALLVVQGENTPAPQVIVREVPVPVEVQVEVPAPAVIEQAAADPEPAVATPAAPAVMRPRNTRVRPRDTASMTDRALDRMDRCGDDPLCMLD